MLKYTTHSEDKIIKISKVKNTTTGKKFISVIFKPGRSAGSWLTGGKYLFSGYEWQFKTLAEATKHATFITLKHG